MNVLVLTTMMPFMRGRAEELSHHLVRNMKVRGVNAEAIRLPFKGNSHERLLDEMFIFKSLQIYNVDRVISLSFPTYLVPSNSRVCWIMGSLQQSYDWLNKNIVEEGDDVRLERIRKVIIENDIEAFQSARRVFAGSGAVQSQIRLHHGIVPDILWAPICDPERFASSGEDDGYILAAARANGTQCHSLLINAMKQLPASAKLLIAGPVDDPAEVGSLQRLVREAGLEARVRLELRAMPRDELARLVCRARAVACLSEVADPTDSLVMEAFEASKPLLTTTASGELCNVVRHGETGIVCEPTPEPLAEGIMALLSSSSKAAEMGSAGRQLWHSLKIDWSTTLDHLLA